MILSLVLTLCLQAQPDLVVFVWDDVASGDLALYGGPVHCPQLEGLAAKGVNFTRCYANPTCAPTRRSILTGHWWLTGNGAGCPQAFPEPNTPPLSEAFLPECLPGYVTGIVGKWHVGTSPSGGLSELAPIEQGFDYWTAGLWSNVADCSGTSFFSWDRIDAQVGWYATGTTTTYEGIAVRNAFNAGWPTQPAPRFAYVCPNLAHAPFHVPPSGLLPPGYVVGNTFRERFEADIIALDTLMGQMLSKIDLQTTTVVVVGDNGTPPNVAPVFSKAKGTTFERGTRVPFVVAGMAVNAPGRSESELVHVVDIWATLIELGSGSIPGGLPYNVSSVSLGPVLASQAHLPLHDFVLVGSRWGADDGDVASVSQAGIKLRWLDADGDGAPDTEQLYDLSLDPGENTNRINDTAYAADLAAARAFIQASIP